MIDPIVTALVDQRRRLGWSQRDLAAKTGLHQGFISNIESAAKPNPTLATLRRLADALGLDLTVEPADARVARLEKALQVCEHVLTRSELTRSEPTDAELHAGQQASGAYATDWRPEDVGHDLPGFEYREVERG